jgi:hypothetical protein
LTIPFCVFRRKSRGWGLRPEEVEWVRPLHRLPRLHLLRDSPSRKIVEGSSG